MVVRGFHVCIVPMEESLDRLRKHINLLKEVERLVLLQELL